MSTQASLAIQLHRAVENIGGNVEAIGKWVTGELEYKRRGEPASSEEESESESGSESTTMSEEEEEEAKLSSKRKKNTLLTLDDDAVTNIKRIASKMTIDAISPFSHFRDSWWIEINGERTSMKALTPEKVERISQGGKISHVALDPLYTAHIVEYLWEKYFPHKKPIIRFVRTTIGSVGNPCAVVYDLPATDSDQKLVGKVVLAVFNSTSFRGLFAYKVGSCVTNLNAGVCVLYRPDQVCVPTPISRGYCMNMEFNIYSNETEAELHKQTVDQVASVLKQYKLPYGLLLDAVNISNPKLTGKDSILLEALESMSVTATHMPVVITLGGTEEYGAGSADGDNLVHCESSVYPFSDTHVNFLLKKTTEKPPADLDQKIKFFTVGDLYIWRCEEVEASSSQREGFQNACYLADALIVTELNKNTKRQKKETEE